MKHIFWILGILLLAILVAGMFFGCGQAVEELIATTTLAPDSTTTTTTTAATTSTSTSSTSSTVPVSTTSTTLPFGLSSSAFSNGAAIPIKYAYVGVGTGENKSVPLTWANKPTGTKSFSLVLVDSSFNNFVHWLATDIPSSETGLAEGASQSNMPSGALEYNNDFSDGSGGYDGPAPPIGTTHTYTFRLYALNVANLNLMMPAGLTDFNTAISGKVISVATLEGTFIGL